MIVINRNLSYTVRETHRQFPGWIYFPCQCIYNGVAAFCSRKPYFQHCFRVFLYFTQVKRSSVKQHDHNIGIDFCNLPQKHELRLRNPDISPACCLTALQIIFADRHYNDLCLLCCFYRFLQHLRSFRFRIFHRQHIPCLIKAFKYIALWHKSTPLHICGFCAVEYFFRCLTDRHAILYISGDRPCTDQTLAVCIRTDKGNLLFRRQRKQSTFVFQKYKGLRCCLSGKCSVCLCQLHLRFLFSSHAFIGIFKQTKLVFQCQNTEHTFIDLCFRNRSVFHQSDQLTSVALCHHINIHTRKCSFMRRIFGILRAAMRDRFINSRKI